MTRSREFQLGGERYVPLTTSTVLHDEWFIVQRRRAKLEHVDARPGESVEDFAQRLYADVVCSGRMRHLLAGLITPAGVPWSPRVARRTARHLGALSGEDKEAVRQLTLSLLIHFFENGLSSLWSSGTALPRAGEQAQRGPGSDDAPGAISGPASGTASFGPYRDTTTSGRAA